MTATTIEAAVDAKAQQAKIKKSDYGHPDHPDGPKMLITTQAQVMSAARGLAKIPDEETRKQVKARITRIAKRKGFALPKSWAVTAAAPKKGSEATATMSDQMVRDALRSALQLDSDPDGDGDNDRDGDPYGMGMSWCYVQDVYDDYFVYEYHDKDDGEDSGLYKRSYSLDANDEAALGADTQRVVRRVSYDPYVATGDDSQESLRESWTEASVATLGRYEKASGDRMGKITGTAIAPGFNRSRKRYYPKETLAAAVEGFVGKKMYIDHPSQWDDKNRPERSVKDIGAVIESAYLAPDGSIGYTAIVADPDLDGRLGLMAERGILGAIGTSVNYNGVGKRETIEGEATEKIESMTLLSLDFVTEAGAWGDVAHLESHVPEGTIEETTDMVDDAVVKALQEKLDDLAKQNTALLESIGGERTARLKAETKATVKDLLAESPLPAQAQAKISGEYEGRESVDGLSDRIASEIAYIEALTGKKLEAAADSGVVEEERRKIQQMRAPKRVVVGNTPAREGDEKPKLPKVAEVGSWLLRENAKTFEEKFVS